MTHVLPEHSDGLTPEILNPLLADSPQFAGANIVKTDVEIIGVGQGRFGEIAKVSLTFDDPNTSAPVSFVAKLPARGEAGKLAFERGTYEREYLFYKELAADCGLPVPDCYYAGYDGEAYRSVLLIEDLSDYHNPKIDEEISFANASLVVRSHAAMHAKWWGGEKLLKQHPWLTPRPEEVIPQQLAMINKGLATARELDSDLMPGGVLEILSRVVDSFDQLVAWFLSDPGTLVQFDSRVANAMFSKSPENPDPVKLIDFGELSFGKAAGEIPYMESTAFSMENRRAYEPDLMRIYHDALLEGGVKDYGWDQFTTDYRWGQFRYSLVTLWVMGLMGTNLEDGFVEDRFPKTVALIDWDCGDLIN